MMSKQIIFVTGNKTKILHAGEAFKPYGFEVVEQKLDIIEPRNEDPEKVVVEKAVQAFKLLSKPLLVEDSGIFINALGGFPKTYVNFALDTLGVKGILKLLDGEKNREVEFRQSLAYISPELDRPKVFSYVDGGFTIAEKIWEPEYPCGDFDRILVPPRESRPLCTFSPEWRANRDVVQNKGRIHYEQLASWLGLSGGVAE